MAEWVAPSARPTVTVTRSSLGATSSTKANQPPSAAGIVLARLDDGDAVLEAVDDGGVADVAGCDAADRLGRAFVPLPPVNQKRSWRRVPADHALERHQVVQEHRAIAFGRDASRSSTRLSTANTTISLPFIGVAVGIKVSVMASPSKSTGRPRVAAGSRGRWADGVPNGVHVGVDGCFTVHRHRLVLAIEVAVEGRQAVAELTPRGQRAAGIGLGQLAHARAYGEGQPARCHRHRRRRVGGVYRQERVLLHHRREAQVLGATVGESDLGDIARLVPDAVVDLLPRVLRRRSRAARTMAPATRRCCGTRPCRPGRRSRIGARRVRVLRAGTARTDRCTAGPPPGRRSPGPRSRCS